MKTFLCMGQSNGVGWTPGGVFPVSNKVTLWNNATNIATLATPGTAWIAPNVHLAPINDGKNNLFYHAARHYADLTGEDVRLIIVAKGGYEIAYWAKKGGTMWARMKAVLAAAGVTSVDALLWHQGESDNAKASTYASSFNALLANLQTDGHIAADTPVVIGQTSQTFPLINPVLNNLATGRVRIARCRSFPTISDLVHFTGTSLTRIGWQYAKHLREAIVGPWTESNMNYVSATAYAAASFPNNVNTKIPVTPELGDTSWINANGAFVAPVPGVYSFKAKLYIAGGKGSRLMLLDSAGGELVDALAYDALSASAVLSGWADLDLAAGTEVYLGGRQSSGATVAPNAEQMALFNKLSVSLVSQHS